MSQDFSTLAVKLAPKFHLIGHRGVKSLRPENTMLGFKLASDLGLNWIEFDVRITKDNSWILMHDQTVDRTTNGKGLVIEKTLQELQALEAGLWFDPPYKHLNIPCLSDVINFGIANDILLNIEVKIEENNITTIQNIVNSFVDYINKSFSSNDMSLSKYPGILVSSFNLEFVRQLKAIQPNLPIGYVVKKLDEEAIAKAIEYNFTTIHCDAKFIKAKYIKLALNKQLPIMAYTVNEKSTADELINLGVSAICTDRPDLLNYEVQTKLGLMK